MDDHDKSLMEYYGITAKQSTAFVYLGNKYDRLQDALNYAKIVTAREQATASRLHSGNVDDATHTAIGENTKGPG